MLVFVPAGAGVPQVSRWMRDKAERLPPLSPDPAGQPTLLRAGPGLLAGLDSAAVREGRGLAAVPAWGECWATPGRDTASDPSPRREGEGTGKGKGRGGGSPSRPGPALPRAVSACGAGGTRGPCLAPERRAGQSPGRCCVLGAGRGPARPSRSVPRWLSPGAGEAAAQQVVGAERSGARLCPWPSATPPPSRAISGPCWGSRFWRSWTAPALRCPPRPGSSSPVAGPGRRRRCGSTDRSSRRWPGRAGARCTTVSSHLGPGPAPSVLFWWLSVAVSAEARA